MYEREKVTLERLEVAATRALSEEQLFNDPKLTEFKIIPDMVHMMAVSLTDFVWSEHLEDQERVVEYPRTWWDFFKQDAIPHLHQTAKASGT